MAVTAWNVLTNDDLAAQIKSDFEEDRIKRDSI
jgi:hypothetical protein